MVFRSSARLGVYIDVENLNRTGGYGMRFDVLRDFAAREGAEPVRLNAYVAYDRKRAETDSKYKTNRLRFHAALRDAGYKVIEKEVKWFVDQTSGERYAKANADLDLALDLLLQSESLGRVLLATGDGDFVPVVRALQNRGCRVEVVGFDHVSSDLRREADAFISGYLIPSLLPATRGNGFTWGDTGSYVRGVRQSYFPEWHYGFLRYLKTIAPGIWNTDTRRDDSPFASVFVHESEFPADVDVNDLPSRDVIFEFTISNSDGKISAKELKSFARS